VAEAVLPVGEIDEARGLDLAGDLLTGWTVQNRIGFFLVPEQEGKVEHTDLRNDSDERRGGGYNHLKQP
jgi:hypothetical protein